MARTTKVLLQLHPHGVVDDFNALHARGERKLYTADEAAALLALEYGGRPIFERVATEPSPEPSKE